MKFSKGVQDGLPIGLGYFAVSFSFGIAGSKLLSWPLVTFISMTNLTSAGQFAGLQSRWRLRLSLSTCATA